MMGGAMKRRCVSDLESYCAAVVKDNMMDSGVVRTTVVKADVVRTIV